jgi:hypothetical protein
LASHHTQQKSRKFVVQWREEEGEETLESLSLSLSLPHGEEVPHNSQQIDECFVLIFPPLLLSFSGEMESMEMAKSVLL